MAISACRSAEGASDASPIQTRREFCQIINRNLPTCWGGEERRNLRIRAGIFPSTSGQAIPLDCLDRRPPLSLHPKLVLPLLRRCVPDRIQGGLTLSAAIPGSDPPTRQPQ